ncbi:MAG TPA: ferritin family protein [Syntrophorhabdales bacterium]|nr:ferritin family protein [Syntrophorhabdales bacterium]
MEGGIRAWKGLVAQKTPESGIAYFSPATTPQEMAGLAWFLENGSRRFYAEVRDMLLGDSTVSGLFTELALAEERHESTLLDLYREFSGKPPSNGHPKSIISVEKDDDVMEGGVRVSEAVQWAKGKSASEVLEFSVGLETNSYDLYLVMEARLKNKPPSKVFRVLAAEEKQHLKRLVALFEERMKK